MRFLGGVALVAGLLCLAGCRGDSNNFDAATVAHALRSNGFEVVGVVSPGGRDFDQVIEEAFPSAVHGGIQGVVTAREPVEHSTPARFTAPLLVEGLIFERGKRASCGVQNIVGSCLHKGNVVLVVRDSREAMARRALGDLG